MHHVSHFEYASVRMLINRVQQDCAVVIASVVGPSCNSEVFSTLVEVGTSAWTLSQGPLVARDVTRGAVAVHF